MTRTIRLPLTLLLTALLAWALASCRQVQPAPDPRPAFPSPRPAPAPAIAMSLPGPSGSAPGDRVVWTAAPPLRAAPRGVGAFLADVESRLPPEMGTHYRDRDHLTWCHETTHGVHAALRNRYGLPAFYPGGGKCALVEAPAITLGDVASALPARFRGSRYNVYLVTQRREWDRDPLYVWDEWVAYDNGTATGIEEGGRRTQGSSDDAVACIELSGYALAVAAAARHKGAPLSAQFREFLAWAGQARPRSCILPSRG